MAEALMNWGERTSKEGGELTPSRKPIAVDCCIVMFDPLKERQQRTQRVLCPSHPHVEPIKLAAVTNNQTTSYQEKQMQSLIPKPTRQLVALSASFKKRVPSKNYILFLNPVLVSLLDE
jgi:hypothetical protein